MPRSPILPVPDRNAIFSSGVTWEEWLAAPDAPAESLQANYDGLILADDVVAALQALPRPVHVIAIAETWCGDVILHTPLLVRMVEATAGKAQLRFITREQYPDFFARFLTNGGEAIPKFVFCSEDFVEVGNWGPMSSTPRKWIAQGKACNDVGSARQKVGEFYQTDKHQESTREFLDLLQTAAFQGF